MGYIIIVTAQLPWNVNWPLWPIMLFSNAQKIPNAAEVESIIMLTKTDMRHEETQFTLLSSAAISVLHVFGFESGYQPIDQPFTSP